MTDRDSGRPLGSRQLVVFNVLRAWPSDGPPPSTSTLAKATGVGLGMICDVVRSLVASGLVAAELVRRADGSAVADARSMARREANRQRMSRRAKEYQASLDEPTPARLKYRALPRCDGRRKTSSGPP